MLNNRLYYSRPNFSRKYNPSRGGHAPGHLRDALINALDQSFATESAWWEGLPGGNTEAQRLLGRLWNCTDIVPSTACDETDVRTGSTFAQLARFLKNEMDR